MKASKWIFVAAIATAAAGGLLVAQTGAQQPDWFNRETGEIRVELMPDRIPMGTSLFKDGVAFLESRNFKEQSNNGPFLVYEFEDSKEPSFWYYKGVGIVPIGQKNPGDTLTTFATIDENGRETVVTIADGEQGK